MTAARASASSPSALTPATTSARVSCSRRFTASAAATVFSAAAARRSSRRPPPPRRATPAHGSTPSAYPQPPDDYRSD